MDSRQSDMSTPSSDSREQDEPAPPGIPESEHQLLALDPNKTNSPLKPALTVKGIEIAKKRLRAFSIQKRTPLNSAPMVKPSTSSTNNTVLIGKLSSIKPVQPKVEDPDVKKPPKPPKPGKKVSQHGSDSYHELQKKTLSEIEDIKRKMELVELGIPLGLICPTSAINEKAMPTKAMPPIKSFLDPKKVDEIIREAKKAKAEGKEFKFDYNRLLPDYDNPFQRKKEDEAKKDKEEESRSDKFRKTDKHKSTRRSSSKGEKSHSKRYSDHKKDGRSRHREKSSDKSSEADASKVTKNVRTNKEDQKKDDDELKGFVVCDSWSLDNEEKTNSSSPSVVEKTVKEATPVDKNLDEPKVPAVVHEPEAIESDDQNDPLLAPVKIEKLQPVIDSFKFEIDEPNEDDMIDLYNIPLPKKRRYESPSPKNLDDDQSKESTNDGMNDDTFLESIINEIKKEDINEEYSPEKGLVEYDPSPCKDEQFSTDPRHGSITPELDESMRELQFSQRSNYSDGYRSGESGYKSGRSSRSSEGYAVSLDKDLDDMMDSKITKATAESLETWSFVLKICQPLLFRHDKNKCYKETRASPKLWYTEAAKRCACVKDRSVVYGELDACKTGLVEALYACDLLSDSPFPTARSWYPQKALESTENATVPIASEWEDDTISFERRDQSGMTQERHHHEEKGEEIRHERQNDMSLDTEYQRFMESVWPAVANKPDSRSTTPTQESKQCQREEDKKRAKKMKLSSEGWSQESDVEEPEVGKKAKSKQAKEKSRKREMSASVDSDSEMEVTPRKKRKSEKKSSLQEKKKSKSKLMKSKRKVKKMKKMKGKHKKKKRSLENLNDNDKENKKKEHKKSKKKKQQKIKKKDLKKKKSKAKSSSSESSSSSTETTTDSESSVEVKKKKKKKDTQSKKKKRDKKRNVSSSDSQHSDLFDVNILKNIKQEKTDDEKGTNKMADQEFSPRRQVTKRPEIINVKELQNDFVGNNIHIKQEIVEEESVSSDVREELAEEVGEEVGEVATEKQECEPAIPAIPAVEEDKEEKSDFKEPEEPPVIKPILDESNQSQASSQTSQASSQTSQESATSVKLGSYEKDDSHLRPSSQNSNYSFNDVIASQSAALGKEEAACEQTYEPENYDVYEQMALAYQAGVADQRVSGQQRIETVVRQRIAGEIKCDWRAGDARAGDPPPRPTRVSRWGLKPGEVNIVLTGANSHQYTGAATPAAGPTGAAGAAATTGPAPPPHDAVYKIESVLSRTDSSCSMSYDEAYMDTYGELDRLQYGDCFGQMALSAAPEAPAPAAPAAPPAPAAPAPCPRDKKEEKRSSLDARIDLALKNTVLGEVAREDAARDDTGTPEKGILVMKSLTESKSSKSVSFADGYKPGQDSDVEDPPKKKKRARRYGCAWPCPATHPDHVALWDALPPPPPPPGAPPVASPVAPAVAPPVAPSPAAPRRVQPPPSNNMPMPMGQMPMGPPMGPQMNPQMGPPINTQMGPPMNSQMGPPMNSQMGPPMNSQMGPPMNSQMGPPMNSQMGPPMNSQMGPPINPQMGPQMNSQMGPMSSMGPLGPQMPMMNNISLPQDMPMGQMAMNQQMHMNGPPMGMNGPPISMNQQMQINQQIQMINSMRLGQEIPMGQMQIPSQMMPPHPGQMEFDASLPNFMPPEPPPGLMSFN